MTGALIYVRLQTGGIPTFWAIMCVIAIEDCRSDGVLHLESAIWNLGYGIWDLLFIRQWNYQGGSTFIATIICLNGQWLWTLLHSSQPISS